MGEGGCEDHEAARYLLFHGGLWALCSIATWWDGGSLPDLKVMRAISETASTIFDFQGYQARNYHE